MDHVGAKCFHGEHGDAGKQDASSVGKGDGRGRHPSSQELRGPPQRAVKEAGDEDSKEPREQQDQGGQ